MTTDSRGQSVSDIAHSAHARCVLCGQRNPWGLNLVFHECADGGVEGVFQGNGYCEGYPNMMHGGIISLLLDGAMTNCLFAYGYAGITARMEVKFRHPVVVDAPVHVRARLVRSSPPAYQLDAEIVQDGQVKASATGLFVDRPELLGRHGETGSE